MYWASIFVFDLRLTTNYFKLPLRRLKVAILKWPIPLADFYSNCGRFLGIVADSSNL